MNDDTSKLLTGGLFTLGMLVMSVIGAFGPDIQFLGIVLVSILVVWGIVVGLGMLGVFDKPKKSVQTKIVPKIYNW